MKYIRIIGLFALLLCLSIPALAVDYFLKIEGVEGESSDFRHKDEIDILSFSWGISNSGTHSGGGGGGAGKVSMQDFHFTMRVNKATPKLMLACATGQHIKEATLTCRKAGSTREDGSQPYLQYKFTDLLISSYSTSSSGNSDDRPTESISFNFSRVEVTYTPVSEDGRPQEPITVVIRPEPELAQ